MSHSLSFDPAELDLDTIHGFLTTSYWSPGIPRETVARAIAGSLCVGAYRERRQIGFARVVSDRATFAYLADVFVLEEARGEGIGRAMVRALMEHHELQGLRRWFLATLDAHGVYEALGWQPVAHPERLLEITVPDIYRR
ncbi:GNAT family N-acetyltransferase [Sphingomonas oligoaromativorans]|uniref:GNAT family N-acetyltransferase n=1 Tax=Sphingomonas oligoaromativorans TaxID=575322 RepID=UPI0014230F63|nr:GNAT family N-acetyltransferase [Sphingomonas oligoaromativorans]NIJ32951.1 GNAT superfamily N-acetyltransferase [Sphingomonas oligoaromativorans]